MTPSHSAKDKTSISYTPAKPAYRGAEKMPPMNVDDVPAAADRLIRKTWLPLISDEENAPTASKFGGTPYLHANEQWPVCGRCHKPMQHFLQLNLNALPISKADVASSQFVAGLPKGLLQFFFCTSKEPGPLCLADNYGNAFAPSHLTRIIQPSGPAAKFNPPAPLFPAKHITNWAEKFDYPSVAEFQLLFGVDPYGKFDNVTFNRLVDREIKKDKLLGWAAWEQNAEYELCPKCKTTMEYFFQIESEDNIPFMFADGGRGQILLCPKDFTTAYVWASG
jgi:hypothetical protein